MTRPMPLLVLLSLAGCSSNPAPLDSGIPVADSGPAAADSGPAAADSGPAAADSGPAAADSGPAAADSGPAADAGAFVAVAPCNQASDYVTTPTSPTISGFTYTPRCLRVSAGASVTLPAQTGIHPLMRGTAGTANSPIPAGPSNTNQTVVFATPGFYSYYCENHGSPAGTGMSGVIQVVP